MELDGRFLQSGGWNILILTSAGVTNLDAYIRCAPCYKIAICFGVLRFDAYKRLILISGDAHKRRPLHLGSSIGVISSIPNFIPYWFRGQNNLAKNYYSYGTVRLSWAWAFPAQG